MSTSELMACTREPQRLVLTVGERSITLVDLPGVGETPEFDAEYMALYHRLFVELDLVIWVLRADDRARAIDITTHRLLLSNGADPSRFLFVITQAECIPPLPTNSECQDRPSPTQCPFVGHHQRPNYGSVSIFLSGNSSFCSYWLQLDGPCRAYGACITDTG